MSTALAITEDLDRNISTIAELLGGNDGKVSKFRAAVMQAYVDNGLSKYSPESVIAAALQSARYGLVPAQGHAWLIPRYNHRKKCTECCFQLGFRGIAVLLARVGIRVEAHTIHANDAFEQYDNGEGLRVRHVPTLGHRGNYIGAFARFHYQKGGLYTHVVGIEQIMRSQSASPAFKIEGGQLVQAQTHSPWYTDPSEMVRRIPLILGSKYIAIEDDLVAEAMVAAEYADFEDVTESEPKAPRKTATTPPPPLAPGERAELPAPKVDTFADSRKAFMTEVARRKEAQEVVIPDATLKALGKDCRAAKTEEELKAAYERHVGFKFNEEEGGDASE